MEKRMEWVKVVSIKQAMFFMSLGASSKIKCGIHDSRERHLHICEDSEGKPEGMVLDDDGGCPFEDLKDSKKELLMLVDVNKLKSIKNA